MRTNSRLPLLALAAWILSLLAATWLARWAHVHEVEHGAGTLQHLGDSVRSVLERELDTRAVLAQVPGIETPHVDVGAISERAAIRAVRARFDYPQGMAATVLDPDYFVVATARGSDAPGAPARDDVLQRVSIGEHGFVQSAAMNGRQSVTYLAGADRYGWNVVMDARPSAFEVRAREVLVPLGAVGILLLIALSTSLYAVRRPREPHEAHGRPQGLPQQPRHGQARAVDLECVLLKSQRFARKVFGNRFEVKAYVQSSLPPVLLDPVLLEQAILNLVFNARRSLGEGGLIVMVARVARTHETATVDRSRYVCLEVSEEEAWEVAPNTQPGVHRSAGQKSGPRTLPAGRQEDPSKTRGRTQRPVNAGPGADPGNGLGVAQVVALIRQWGGDVRFHRLSGQPVRTCLILPAAEPADFAPTIRKAAVEAAAGSSGS